MLIMLAGYLAGALAAKDSGIASTVSRVCGYG